MNAPGIGHNAPPLAEQLALDHADLLVAVHAIEVPEHLSSVTSDNDAAIYTEWAAEIKKVITQADKAFKAAKQPWLDGGRVVETFFSFRATLSVAATRVVAEINCYQNAKRAAQQKADAEAAEAARAAATPFDDEPSVVIATAPKDAVRVVTSTGVKASGTIKWQTRVVDFDKVPREYLILNDAAISAAVKGIKARGGKIEDSKNAIPGIEIYETISTSIR